MKIKARCVKTGQEFEFSTPEYHLSIHLSELELDQVKSLPASPDGKSPSGKPYRTFAVLVDHENDDHLAEWSLM